MKIYTHRQALELSGLTLSHFKVLLLAGLSSIGEGSIVLIIPVLTSWIQCEFKVSNFTTTLMNVVMYAARITGALIKGTLSDHYGRIKAFQFFLALTTWSCIVFALSPSLTWIMISRTIMGLSTGALSTGFIVEYLAPSARKFYSPTRDAYDGGGALVMSIAYFGIAFLQWRGIFILLSVTPLICYLFAASIPDPPRFLMVQGKTKEAASALKYLTKSATLERPFMVTFPELERSSKIKEEATFLSDLFSKRYLRVTIIISLLMFSCGFFSIGSLMLSVTYIRELKSSTLIVSDVKCSHCTYLANEYYRDQIVLSFSSVLGGLITFLLLDRLGRIKVMAGMLLIQSLAFFSLNIWSHPGNVRVMLALAKLGTTGYSNACAVYITEIYATYIRERTYSWSLLFRGIGEIVAVLISEMMVTWNRKVSSFIFLVFSVASLISCFLLPLETSGRELDDY